MDIINHLEAFSEELEQEDTGRAERVKDLIDDLIEAINLLDEPDCLHNWQDGICKTCGAKNYN